ncbi:TPA: hypothetical protein ACH3X2_010479 [Trebouxia sp. C0005]
MAPPKTRSQRKRPVRFLEDCEDAHPATKQTRAIEDALQLQSSTPTNALQHRSDASQLATLHHVSSLPSPQLQTPPVSHQAESASRALNPQPSCRPQFYAFAHPISEHQADSLSPGLSEHRVNNHPQPAPVTDNVHLSQNRANDAVKSQIGLHSQAHVKAQPLSGPITNSHPQAASQDAAQPGHLLHAQVPPQPTPQQTPTQAQQTEFQLQSQTPAQPSNHSQHQHPPQSSAAPKPAAQAQAAPTPAAPLPVSAQQDTYPVLLQLDARMAPAVSLRLAKHKPNSAVIKFWKVYYQNFAVYNLQLIGDAQQQPGESVGIGTQDLMIHSAWAASLLPTTDTSRQASANRIDMLLPVKTPASVVSKMVESLHSGTLSLGHENVEQMLVLSHAMKVKLVEAACKKYLLDLDLSLEQLCQLVLLWDRLGDMSALTDTLHKLTWKPWLTPVAQAVARAFQHLLQGDGTRLEAARGVLQSPSCGKMCELQVFDMLLSAGISMSDPLLTTFLQVARINDAAFGFLEHAVQPSTISRPSYELLIQVVARTAKFASWSDASSDAQEPLMMVAFDDKRELSRCDFDLRWHDLTFRVKLPQLGAEASSETSADPTQYTLEMISPDKSLTGREAVTVVLISLSKSMPIVKPLCEWHMGNAGCMWTALSCAAKGIERQLASKESFCLGLRVCMQ